MNSDDHNRTSFRITVFLSGIGKVDIELFNARVITVLLSLLLSLLSLLTGHRLNVLD
jgi:hypothetical protein